MLVVLARPLYSHEYGGTFSEGHLAPCLRHGPSSTLLMRRSHTVPPCCKEGVKHSTGCLRADFAGRADTNALQQPLSSCHSLPWRSPSHGGLVGRLEGERGGVHPQDCLCQVCADACKPMASATPRASLVVPMQERLSVAEHAGNSCCAGSIAHS